MRKIGLIACCAAAALHGEVFTLGKVEVTQNVGGLQKSDANVVVLDEQKLQKDDIKRLSEVAYSTPGIYVDKKGPRAEQNFYVRGFDARRTPLFIDGIPVYVPYDGNADFGRFTTFDLSRIDISKGSSSVLYGPNTMGGAINLITKKPSKELEGSLGYGFETGKNAKTYGNNVDFSIGTKQELFYAQAGGSYMEDAGQQLSRKFNQKVTGNEDGGRRDNSVQRDKKFNIKFGFTPNETDEYAVAYVNQKGEKEQPMYTGRYAAFSQKDRLWEWPQWDRQSIYFLSHTEFANSLYINTKAFADEFKNEMYDISALEDSKYKDTAYGFSLETGGNIGDKDTLKFAANYKRDKHSGYRVHYTGRFGTEPTVTFVDKTYSFALENTYKFSDFTRLILGVSYDVRDAVKAEDYIQFRGGGGGGGGRNNPANYKLISFDVGKKHAFNYQAAIKHSFDGEDELSLSFAKKTYFASMKDRYSERFGRFFANPYLKPETANHYEVGYQRNFGEALRLETAVFYSRVKDAIGSTSVTKFGQTRDMAVNVDRAYYKGFEIGASYFATRDLELGGNYTYMSAKYKENGKDALVYDLPKHKGFLYVDYKILPKFSVYASQELSSSLWSRLPTRAGHVDHKTAGFGVTNLKFTYKPTEALSFEAGVLNLFDKNYEYREGFPEEGRIFFTNVRYKF
nr:TonB-dependent receptor [uncultured Campylobacter sp.]